MCLTVCLTQIADKIYSPAMFGYAQGVICHAGTPSNVAQDKNVDGHTATRPSGWAIVLGGAENQICHPRFDNEKKQNKKKDPDQLHCASVSRLARISAVRQVLRWEGPVHFSRRTGS